jgi:PilZ domain
MTTQTVEEAPARVERRHSPRKKFSAGIEIEWGATMLDGTVRDIGVRGLFIELDPPLWLGAAFRARLKLNPAVALDCKVVRVEPGAGVAVMFEAPEESSRAQIEKLLMSLSPA